MVIGEVKTIRCRQCKSEFEPLYRNGIILSRYCIQCLSQRGKEKIRKQRESDWKKEKKKIKEKLKTHSEWVKDFQAVFNTYIRARDKNKPCISCGRPLRGQYDAGHFFSVGAKPNLRFNEDNVHGQCVYCNQHLRGNVAEYSVNLPKRIGQARFDALVAIKEENFKLTIPEIQEKIKEYRNKTKEYETR